MVLDTVTFKKPQISYDSRDYEACRDDAIRSIPFFCPEWTNHNPSDPGIAIIEAVSVLADVAHWYVDRVLFDGFWGTCLTRDSMANLAKLIDFTLSAAAAAKVDLTFSIDATLGSDLLIPAGTLVSTSGSDQIFFETDEDATIVAGTTEITIGAQEGQTEVLPLLTSTGEENQSFQLTPDNVIEGSVKIDIDEGSGYLPWSFVDSLYTSMPTSKDFETDRDGQNLVSVIFGDGSTGKIPAVAAPIRPTVRVGGGLVGNVGLGSINTVVSTILFGGNPISVSVTNAADASGGNNPMTIAVARRQGPQAFKAGNRCMNAEDFEAEAMKYPGVTKARATAKPMNKGNKTCCGVSVAVAVAGSGIPSQGTKDGLTTVLQSKAMIGTAVEIEDPVLVNIDVEGTVFVGSAVGLAATQQLVQTEVANFFDPVGDVIDFGSPIFLSQLYGSLRDVVGVDHVDLAQLTRRPIVDKIQWNGVGAFSLIKVGIESVDEVWTASFLTPTTFRVRGTISGLQAAVGSVGVPYVSDRGQVSFTLAGGSPANLAGDFAEFRTSPKVANVPIDPNEIPKQGVVNLSYVVVARAGRIC